MIRIPFLSRWLAGSDGRRRAAQGLFAPMRSDMRPTAAYAAAVAILCAKLAKSDGAVNRAEIDAFKRLFPAYLTLVPAMGRLFDLARENADGFEPAAVQLAMSEGRGSAALEDLLDRLLQLALSDKTCTPEELRFLGRVAGLFGLDTYWQGVMIRRVRDDEDYHVLGVAPDASDAEIRAAWRQLSRRYHPDAVVGRGSSGESEKGRMALINAAYSRIMQERRRRA